MRIHAVFMRAFADFGCAQEGAVFCIGNFSFWLSIRLGRSPDEELPSSSVARREEIICKWLGRHALDDAGLSTSMGNSVPRISQELRLKANADPSASVAKATLAQDDSVRGCRGCKIDVTGEGSRIGDREATPSEKKQPRILRSRGDQVMLIFDHKTKCR